MLCFTARQKSDGVYVVFCSENKNAHYSIMAPVKGKPASNRGSSKTGGSRTASKTASVRKSKPKSKVALPGKSVSERKTKPLSHKPEKKKRRIYTDKELGIPALNGIRPAGIAKPRGVKKGKTFVDDREGMMAILAMVQAEKEGDIESKIMKARQLEEVREAKRAEMERREGEKRKRFEEVKDEVRRKKGERRKNVPSTQQDEATEQPPKKTKKRVSFG